jgi:hypothetical protein
MIDRLRDIGGVLCCIAITVGFYLAYQPLGYIIGGALGIVALLLLGPTGGRRDGGT